MTPGPRKLIAIEVRLRYAAETRWADIENRHIIEIDALTGWYVGSECFVYTVPDRREIHERSVRHYARRVVFQVPTSFREGTAPLFFPLLSPGPAPGTYALVDSVETLHEQEHARQSVTTRQDGAVVVSVRAATWEEGRVMQLVFRPGAPWYEPFDPTGVLKFKLTDHGVRSTPPD